MRSLVARTLLLVVGVVVLLGAALVSWIAAEDRREALDAARREQQQAESEARELARDLLGTSQEVSQSLVEGAARRLVRWIEEEPLGLYRDARDPSRIDVQAIRAALTAEVRQRGQAESEHARLLVARLSDAAHERIDRLAAVARGAAQARARTATAERGVRLALRLALLLVGLASVLGLVLLVSVVNPVRRIRGAVRRIAGGDLHTPLAPVGRGPVEFRGLTQDLDRMREQIRGATLHLEQEVARKTEHLSTALGERTRALEELSATKDRLVQTAKMAGLGTLAGGVAHEFNNLLGGILANLENALAGSTDASVREDLGLATKTAQRASTLVQALLGVARPGQRALAAVSLAGVAADALEAARPAAQRRRVHLEHRREADATVLGDDGQLHQVALNLLTNALQAVPDGGHVLVRTGVRDRFALLEVEDDGPGVKPEDRERLFEPFFTTRDDGTGLGLFISYGIVERHGGRIEVGAPSGGGARFSVLLPRA